MTLSQEHKDFENFSLKLVGQKIICVEYAEFDYEESPTPYYPTKYKNLDSIDFSIFFHTDKNDLIEIHWDDTFFQYGIGIKVNEKSDFSNVKKWEVTKNELWDKFIGSEIIDVKITWEAVRTTEQKSGEAEIFIYPQYIEIKFSNDKRIYISASQFLNYDDDVVYGMSDNLTVTDNEELAKNVKMIM
jgi:hypothetical protein